MKKILIFLLTAVIISGCYTTLYPPISQQIEGTAEIPDSTRQIIINNYYETTEYYQVPRYHRYSLIWGSHIWDPFYYDYSYYHWRPYYWYGSYYYYNPYNNYWFYYDHHYPGYWTGGGGSGGRNDQERIHKPGYRVLGSTTDNAAPFISVGSQIERISRPGKKSNIDINSGIGTSSMRSTSPQIESVGKSSLNTSGGSSIKKESTGGTSSPAVKENKPSSTSRGTVTKPSTRQSNSSTRSKPASTTRSTPKSSGTEESSSSGTSKKSR